MTPKIEKVEKWRMIGDNSPLLEISGPYSNQYTIFIEDIDGDIIAVKPAEAKRLIQRLTKALDVISARRVEALGKVVIR